MKLGRSAFVVALALAGCNQPKSDARPCIVLVSIDSLRPDHLGCYGYKKPTSPTIDAIAKEGVRFETAVSTTSWTLPAHAAMFTGLYDSAHGLYENELSLADSQVTLAEALHDAGYRTAGFYGGPYLHPTFGLNQGFEYYQSCMTQIDEKSSGAQIREHSTAHFDAAHRDITGPRTIEEVKKWAETDDPRPFFVFVHLWDVHYDYIPPKHYVDLFDPGYKGDFNAATLMANSDVSVEHMKKKPRDFQHLLALYDGEIRFTDDNLTEILRTLEDKAGGKENLMLLVTADHGEEFFEHGGKGHQQTLYDEVVKVPMVMRWPGHLDAGRVVKEQVRLIDIMPSLCDIGHAKAPNYVQGRDLIPLLAQGGPLPTEPALLELLVHPKSSRALRTENFKAVSTELGKLRAGFELDKDAKEANAIPDTDERVKKSVEQIRAMVDRSLEIRQLTQGDPKRVKVDPKLEAWMRRLGYLDGKKSAPPTDENGSAPKDDEKK